MSAARKPAEKLVKIVDECAAVRCAAGDGLIREEVWADAEGQVLATIWPL